MRAGFEAWWIYICTSGKSRRFFLNSNSCRVIHSLGIRVAKMTSLPVQWVDEGTSWASPFSSVLPISLFHSPIRRHALSEGHRYSGWLDSAVLLLATKRELLLGY